MSRGLVFNIQRFSTDDGDGIRTCVFLKGCPLRCPWCHNAESLSKKSELAFHENSCIGCGSCAAACSRGAISMPNEICRIDREACALCFKCAEACNSGALEIVGKRMSVDEVMKTVLRDKAFYVDVGGVTVSGGEPMSQPEFTLAIAKAALEAGITVAIETSGFGKREDFAALIPYCNLFLFDCKASSERHRELVGVDDEKILENLDLVATSGKRIILRCPIVPGANLDKCFVEKIVTLAKKYDAVSAVQLMPYHKTGSGKSLTLGGNAQTVFSVPEEKVLFTLSEYIAKESGKKTFFNR